MGRTVSIENQVLYSTILSLLNQLAVQPLHILVPVQNIYTSTPHIVPTECTEAHFLHSTSITLLPIWDLQLVQSLSSCRVHLYFY